MKPKSALRSFLALAGSSLLAISYSHAGNTWDGGGGTGFWNNGTNWNVDGLPNTGALTFVNDTQTSTNNDLAAALTYAGINFTNDGSAGKTNAFTLAGNSITLGGNITTTANTAGSTITDLISLNMILNGNRTITTNQQSASVQHNLTVSGIISQDATPRNLTKSGGGVLTLSGQNSYTGITSVTAGTLRAGAAANGQAFGLGSAVSLSNVAGVTLDLNGFNQTIGSLAGGGATGGNVTLGSGTLTMGGNNTATQYSGIISGSGGIIKTGSGIMTLQLSSVNTYQGGTTVSGGLLLVNTDSGLGNAAGSVTLNGGGLGIGANISSNRELILNNVSGNLVRLQGNVAWTNTGNITGDGGVIFRQNPNGGVTANLQGTANTFKGALGIEFGNGGIIVRLRSMEDSATANGNIVYGIGSSANTGGSGQIFEWDIAAASALTLNNRAIEFGQNGAAWGTIKNSNTTNAITIGTNLVVSGTGSKTLVLESVDGPRNAFNGNITDGSGTVVLRKEGAGDWVLGGTNSYTGGTAITVGGLTFLDTGAKSSTGTHAFSANTMLGLGVSGASGFTATDITNAFAGGTLTGNLSGITVTTSTNVGVDTTNGNFTLGSNIAATSKQLHKLGNNTLTLTGTNANTGLVIAKQGTLKFGTAASLTSSTAARLAARSGSTLAFNVGGGGEFNAAGVTAILNNQTTSTGLTNGMNAGSSLGFDTTNAGGSFTIADIIADTGGAAGGARGLTKLGTGSLILTNTNTYTGATVVSAGTLEIGSTGSTAAGSAVTVNGTAALVVNGTLNGSLFANTSTTVSGTGTVVGNANILGTHNPGNSPGIQTYGADLTYSGGASIVNWELGDNTTTNAANPNAVFDQIIVGGNLAFTDLTTLNLLFTGGSVLWSDSLWDTDQSWVLYDVTGTTTGLGNLTLNTTDWLDSGSFAFNTARSGNLFTLSQSGQDILINYTVVPEPSSAVLLGALGTLALLRRRR